MIIFIQQILSDNSAIKREQQRKYRRKNYGKRVECMPGIVLHLFAMSNDSISSQLCYLSVCVFWQLHLNSTLYFISGRQRHTVAKCETFAFKRWVRSSFELTTFLDFSPFSRFCFLNIPKSRMFAKEKLLNSHTHIHSSECLFHGTQFACEAQFRQVVSFVCLTQTSHQFKSNSTLASETNQFAFRSS